MLNIFQIFFWKIIQWSTITGAFTQIKSIWAHLTSIYTVHKFNRNCILVKNISLFCLETFCILECLYPETSVYQSVVHFPRSLRDMKILWPNPPGVCLLSNTAVLYGSRWCQRLYCCKNIEIILAKCSF